MAAKTQSGQGHDAGADTTRRETPGHGSAPAISRDFLPQVCLYQPAPGDVTTWTRRSDHTFAQGFRDGFGLRVDLQLFVNLLQVKGDGVDGNTHRVGRGLVMMPIDHEREQGRL